MKFIAYNEYDPKDFEKVLEKTAQIAEERKKEPNKYPKPISALYGISGRGGFMLYEVDNDEQLMNLTIFYFPYLTFEFVAIKETTKEVFSALLQSMKK